MEESTLTRFADNMNRVENLVGLYVGLRGSGQGRRPVNSSDLLRASVVMLHASLEDFFRSVARERLPAAMPQSLEVIPLAGSGSRRPEKFTLADVAGFRGKSVEELLGASIDEYLDRSSYNNPGELKRLLEDLGVDLATVQAPWDEVGAMMDRRHWIVHQADRNVNQGQGQHRARSLSEQRVRTWIQAVRELVKAVSLQV